MLHEVSSSRRLSVTSSFVALAVFLVVSDHIGRAQQAPPAPAQPPAAGQPAAAPQGPGGAQGRAAARVVVRGGAAAACGQPSAPVRGITAAVAVGAST
jgi:hypothetical protein